MKIHDLLNNRQAQPGSFPNRLGRKKWIKYLRQIHWRYAGAGILHLREHHLLAPAELSEGRFVHLQVLAELSGTRGHRKNAAWGHRLAGVNQAVVEHLIDLRT